MKIGDLARRCGLSAHTLRYYETIGLLPRAGRDVGGRRDYDVTILTWIDFLRRLKTTGMPISQMRRYADLRARGAGSEGERHALLSAHRGEVAARIAALQECLAVLDTKIAGYAGFSRKGRDRDFQDADDAGHARHDALRTGRPRPRGH